MHSQSGHDLVLTSMRISTGGVILEVVIGMCFSLVVDVNVGGVGVELDGEVFSAAGKERLEGKGGAGMFSPFGIS